MKKTMAPRRKKSTGGPLTWQWEDLLENDNTVSVASVLAFPHAPLYSSWKGISVVGTVGEVDSSSVAKRESIRKDWREKKHFWHVEVVKYAGYFCQIRFLGYPCSQAELIEANKVWLHISNVKEIGHFRSTDISNSPPFAMNAAEEEVKGLLYKSIYNHYSVCRIDLELSRSTENYVMKWPMNSPVETVNKDCCRQMRRGIVKKEIGRRLFVRYCDYRNDNSNSGYWVHDTSDLIKPQGWCRSVGAEISDAQYYHPEILPKEHFGISDTHICIEQGMLFEMVNPIRRNEIAVGKVTKALQHGYFLCCIESVVFPSDLEKHCNGVNEFHFHISSDLIFPCGTCATFGQLMCKPGNDEVMVNQFDWKKFLKETGARALPFPEKRLVHTENMFKKGMWLEAVDSHDSQLVCPAIVVAKMSPYVIKIRFFGWDEKYDQWKSIESEEVFPMGWCQLVNYPLAPPGPNYPGRFQGCDSPGNGRIQVKKNIPIQKGTKRKLVIADNSSRSTSVSSEDHGSVSSASSGISDRKKLSRF